MRSSQSKEVRDGRKGLLEKWVREEESKKRPRTVIEVESPRDSNSSVNNEPKRLKGRGYGKDLNWLIEHLGQVMDERNQKTAIVANAFPVTMLSSEDQDRVTMSTTPVAMRVISWICRGFNRPPTKQHLRQLLLQFKPEILFLQETKLSSIFWNGNLDFEILEKSSHCIAARFKDILDPGNKCGGLKMRDQQSQHLRGILNELDMTEVPFRGNKYTWSNNHKGKEWILERLGRAFADHAWFDIYPYPYVMNLPIAISDKGPLVLSTGREQIPQNISKNHFEAFWSRNEVAFEIIKKVWFEKDDIFISNDPRMMSNLLETILKSLASWSKQSFGGMNLRIR
ncbi:OLC1v1003752C1 [Oldenlandia corymbosa var. corymbosa]|uniref:OLC1v1003752C1 n=1 Tax=Oldenlandia corymbosa var. corymbosa TaxID=529605 RepID=A0AAV1DE44_OLDCO|nr:OLC1v1003752C1 [Oldenlandia corymbosa var. corymbosa]